MSAVDKCALAAIMAILPNELINLFLKGATMARWTAESRAKQSVLIHNWKPWMHNTGACTPKGKAICSLNACRGYWRRRVRFAHWLLWARYHTTRLTPELANEAKRRADKLRVFDDSQLERWQR